jgi:class 3 adenylate cyclase/tetratricopeptide (TPR) repeat protein/ribosomal protein L40E
MSESINFLLCRICSFKNAADAKFCENCGAPLVWVCSSCGTENTPRAKFCKNCGARIEALSVSEGQDRLQVLQQIAPRGLQDKMREARDLIEGERKPVTILFADIVGSTAIAEKLDPEEWKEIVSGAHRRISEAVYRYEGTIAQLLGDGVLAFFGAPITHEDDPVRAVRAALDLQEAIGEYRFELAGFIDDFQMRIGINTGTVVIGEIGTDMHVEYLAIGDAVNITARLQSAAQPGKVLLSETSARLVQDSFELKSLGDIQVKGKVEALTVYEVIEARIMAAAKRGIEGFITPYVGRARDVEKLQSALCSLCEGHGQIVAVVGEAGIGKTRLIEEVRALPCEEGDDLERTPASPSSIQWLEGRSLSYGSSLSYWAITQLLLADLGLSDGSPQVKIKVALQRRLKELFIDEKISELMPYLAHLLGISREVEAETLFQAQDSEILKWGTLKSLQDYFTRIAEEQPTVLIFEDMHWADLSSLKALENLFALTDRGPLMILMLMRIERTHGSWGTKLRAETDFPHRYTEIHLRRLSEGDSHQLVDHLLGPGELPEEVEQEIRARSEGNPFYLEEIVRHLMDEGLIVHDDGRWRVTEGIHEFGIPDSLHGVLLARIDRLDEEVRRTLQMASVIGKSFLYRILEAISEAEQQLDEHLSQLQRLDLVREKARIPELEYHFKHTLTQEATYNSLLHERRKEFHLKVGEALEGLFPDRVEDFLGFLAYHFEIAEAYEKALDYLSRAELRARFDGALRDALDYQKRILRICEELGDPLKLGSAEVWLGWIFSVLGDRKASLEHLHHALKVLEGEGETKELAWGLSHLSRISMVASEYDKGIIWGERALELGEKFGDEVVMVANLNTVGVCRVHKGEEESGLDALRESLRRSQASGFPDHINRAYYNLGECLRNLGHYVEARLLYEEFLGYTRQVASRIEEQSAMTDLIQLDWRCGRWGEAICNRAFIKDLPVGIYRIWTKTVEGRMENDLGRPEETLELLKGMLSDVLDTGEIQTIAPYLEQLTRAYAAMDMDRETKDTLHLLLEHIDHVKGFNINMAMPLLFACWWFASRSDAKSLEASRECASRLAEGSDQKHFPMIAAALSEANGFVALSKKKGIQAVDCFLDAVGRWEALGLPYDQARALEGLGRAHALAKDMEAASSAYDQAYEIIEMLAAQLGDDDLKESFMTSLLVEEVQQKR